MPTVLFVVQLLQLLLLLTPTVLNASDLSAWEAELARKAWDKGWFPDDKTIAHPDLSAMVSAMAGAGAGVDTSALSGIGRRLQVHVQVPNLLYAAQHIHMAGTYKNNVTNIAHFDLITALQEQGREASMSLGPRAAAIKRRCRHTRGKWCGRFIMQPSVPWKAAPRGSKQCRTNCNGVGNCNYDLGLCDCPAGWKGDDCSEPDKRPCTNRPREDNSTERSSHIDKDGRDSNWLEDGWSASRCAGICDDDLAMCWCDGKHKRIPAPPGSPPGTPPLQRGRPLSEFCGKVEKTADGQKTTWGNVKYDRVYGPGGWCNADRPDDDHLCDVCQLDDLDGRHCDIVKEAYCLNQCSGHGECNLGFCKCHQGWYGLDCSRKVAGAQMEPADTEPGGLAPKPWLRSPGLGQLPIASRAGGTGGQGQGQAAASSSQAATAGDGSSSAVARLRPLIYVYDSPPAYTTRMLQYRLVWKACIWRNFNERNESQLHDWLYGVETYFHEQLLASPHRTFDPEEADFFYVPLYVTCYFWPIIGWADHPWWYVPEGVSRPMHGANMMLELKRWLEEAFPFWKRRGGRDHIWLVAADEGACWMPSEIYDNSIILSHWGRLGDNTESGTAFFRDVYSMQYVPIKPGYARYQPTDWRDLWRNHTCYNPKKDLVIPSYKLPSHYASSPLLGAEPFHRDIRLFFRGDVGDPPREPRYSRGIRQKLNHLHREGKWREKHNIYILNPIEHAGSYTQLLARSVFCLVAPGDGWSGRAEDAVLHGCLPFIIMDNVHAVFESILEWDAFSIRIKESSIPDIPQILAAITDDQIARMQRKLAEVWHRFAYATGSLLQKDIQRHLDKNLNFQTGTSVPLPDAYPIHKVREFPFQDDAFGTIMQWLYSRIPDVKRADNVQ